VFAYVTCFIYGLRLTFVEQPQVITGQSLYLRRSAPFASLFSVLSFPLYLFYRRTVFTCGAGVKKRAFPFPPSPFPSPRPRRTRVIDACVLGAGNLPAPVPVCLSHPRLPSRRLSLSPPCTVPLLYFDLIAYIQAIGHFSFVRSFANPLTFVICSSLFANLLVLPVYPSGPRGLRKDPLRTP